ncbi:hypothetical protein [Acinetobacter baumannii]|uniref:hypothetical protein n=1 Tax=Acinetobacter baumannii TaxID=470 RepID=UPI00112E1CAD|nr:hypothetical protein [Acinetobacter baumannii]TPT82704.1 hypothetical protein FJU52_14215 [Acinetobacter baumannii]
MIKAGLDNRLFCALGTIKIRKFGHQQNKEVIYFNGESMASRITKTLTYNLANRGRKYGGKDRSNVDIQGMIRKINSPEVQEQVDAGFMNGFCGHQIRQRWGMVPPESIEIDGKIIYLEPATRTLSVKAFDDGTVEHKQEFFENVAGEHVMRQYKAKIGGFSTAVNFFVDGPILRPNMAGAFYQSVIEGAEINIELIQKAIDFASEDATHYLLSEATEVIKKSILDNFQKDAP